MSIPKKLCKFLDKHKINYEVVLHPEAVSSQVVAQLEHVSGNELAKVVMVKADGKDVMTVLPASHTVDLLKLSSVLGVTKIYVQDESEFGTLFPDCEVGAMPPFGQMYELPSVIDASLMEGDQIIFNAGTKTESVKIYTEDFVRVVKGTVAEFSVVGKKIKSERKSAKKGTCCGLGH